MIAVLWLGFVLAISFMEAPLKFRAPHVSREAALSIGRLVFRALVRVELVLLLLLLAALWQAGWPPSARPWLWTVLAIVAVQRLWLLPRLDRRLAATLAGQPVGGRRDAHWLYAAGECLKVVALPALAWSLIQPLAS